MFSVWHTCFLFRVYSCDSHFFHQLWYFVSSESVSFTLKLNTYSPCSIERILRIYLIYFSHNILLLCIAFRYMVNTAAGNSQKVRLSRERNMRISKVHHSFSRTIRARCQIFFWASRSLRKAGLFENRVSLFLLRSVWIFGKYFSLSQIRFLSVLGVLSSIGLPGLGVLHIENLFLI